MKKILQKIVVYFPLAFLLFSLASCDDSVKEGTFSITFSWADEKPATDEELYAWVKCFV